MSSTNASRRFLLIAARVLLVLIVIMGAVQSGTPANYVDAHGFFFVLIGGAALVMISFPGASIAHAFRHVVAVSGTDAEFHDATRVWEAAGRSFWIAGGLGSVLSIMIGFVGMRTVETAGFSAILPILIRSLLSTFYGGLLAVICFVPCWRLLGVLQGRPPLPVSELKGTRLGWGYGATFGYVLFLSVLIWTIRPLFTISIWPVFRPPLMVVLGGAIVLILFVGQSGARLTRSAAFACMGLVASLMGFIQMLHGMTDPTPRGIGQVAMALAFILLSCSIALMGMALIGAPLEDRAIRMGSDQAPSPFSRVAWYAFPLLSLIFLIIVFNMIIVPLPPSR